MKLYQKLTVATTGVVVIASSGAAFIANSNKARNHEPHKSQGLKVPVISLQLTMIEESAEYVSVLNSRCSVTLQPQIEGQVTNIFVKLGEQVAVGKAIVQVAPVKQQEQFAPVKISTPCAGMVGDILVNEGENVNTSSKLVTITQNQPLEVNTAIPSEDALRLRLRMPVELMDAQNRSISTTKVFFISPNADNHNAVLIKLLFDNSNGQLRNGQYVKVKVIWAKHPGFLIPVTAVYRIDGHNYVFIAQPQERSKQGQVQLVARQKLVKLGGIQGDKQQIIEGLQSGDKIITSLILQLKDGTSIIPDIQSKL